MLKTILAISAMLGVALAVPEDHWAVLVAGSRYYSNYRHQADIFHAYHVLRDNGFLEERIITMAYDDIAHNLDNPVWGKVFNAPDGEDVYEGVKIDYKRWSVTPQNFLAILKNDESALGNLMDGNGKVLKTDKDSKVFIYFADHGAPGFVSFPSDHLYADDWIDAINYMYENELYGEMVIYLEACESGSMFENLLDENINVYATTAANAEESSWGTYCHPDDVVDGVDIGSCLGDLYSVVWMEDSDAKDEEKETVGQQYQVVKQKTTMSHVQQFGEFDLKDFAIGKYQGIFEQEKASSFYQRVLKGKAKKLTQEERSLLQQRSAVDSRDNTLHYLYAKVLRTGSEEAHVALMNELEARVRADKVFEKFVGSPLSDITEFPHVHNFDCLKTAVGTYEAHCGEFTDYSLKHVKHLVRSCEMENRPMGAIMARLENACKEI